MLSLDRAAHLFAGFLSSLAVIISPLLTLIGFAGFELYEIWEYEEFKDWPTTETLEFMVGFFAAIFLMLLGSI